MDRASYEADICDRLQHAECIPFRSASLEEWKPEVADCHRNVDAWVKAHPDCKAVRGWVTYAWFSDNSTGLTAHSVVQGADGELFDITPLERESLRSGMRFIRHVGDEESFAIERHRNLSITCSCSGESHDEA
jgi:hypothetical protein